MSSYILDVANGNFLRAPKVLRETSANLSLSSKTTVMLTERAAPCF
jgi:hypothetical protein